jgi:hypothetical protein
MGILEFRWETESMRFTYFFFGRCDGWSRSQVRVTPITLQIRTNIPHNEEQRHCRIQPHAYITSKKSTTRSRPLDRDQSKYSGRTVLLNCP